MKKLGNSLLKAGSCNLHIVHNDFKTGSLVLSISPERFLFFIIFYLFSGIFSVDWHVESVCTQIYSWFKQSPVRKDDLMTAIDEYNDVMEKTFYFICSNPMGVTRQSHITIIK